ncbi:hypothetical protein [Paraburkholderia sp. J41]|uniref:hypothetical protein n=1 Tax=Paraburkholderia sp. J41 TaxID=2805433 RepID=UPI002AC36B90|nr:hypothetical protein [Paraburkholderia sp. J41]
MTNATGNAAPALNMRPLCAVGVSAETSVPLAVAPEVAGAPHVIEPAAMAEPSRPRVAALGADESGPAAALDPPPAFEFALAFVAFVALAAFVPEPPPPHAVSTIADERSKQISFIVLTGKATPSRQARQIALSMRAEVDEYWVAGIPLIHAEIRVTT